MSAPVSGTDPELLGFRVLVVEDEAAISLLLEDMLLELGCEVVGPVGRLGAALEAAAGTDFDVAVLDVNLAGQPIYPVAEALAARNLPFVFSTGYGAGGIDPAYRGRPVLQKPFSQHELQRVLRAVRAG